MWVLFSLRRDTRRPRSVVSAENPYFAPDRATRNVMQEWREQLDCARRYWACPF